MNKYVIVGDGIAGFSAAQNIRKTDTQAEIIMVSQEDLPPYYRIRLNDFIAGEVSEQGLQLKNPSWYEENSIELLLETEVESGDPEKKSVTTSSGKEIEYDKLLIASGSHSFIPPVEGTDKQGVFALRNIYNAREISKWAQGVDNVVMIGGGLLGLETANALRKLGKRIAVVEFFPRLLPRQLDEKGAEKLRSNMENMGFEFKLGVKTKSLQGEDRVETAILDNGEEIPAEMAVFSAGVRPNSKLASSMGLELNKGILVDDYLQTSDPHIYAAGDVAEWNGTLYGIWPPAMEQGNIAGLNMAGEKTKYQGTTMSTKLKVVGIDLASAGEIDIENKFDSKVYSRGEVYKKVVIDNNQVIGCIMLGDLKDFNRITGMMSDGSDVSGIKDSLLPG